MKRSAASTALATLIFLVVAVLAALLSEGPPPELLTVVPTARLFVTGNAFAHVQAIAAKAHPTGSAAHDEVRDYILARLSALGLQPQVQKATGVVKKYRAAGTVENIVARIPGTSGSSSAIALMAHYDSVAAGPGASDDGAGVATLLETARALLASPRLKNDIILLFTDGEEAGLVGAAAFVDEHPWAKDVRLALNFEARGTSGSVWLFETSANNGRLIREVAYAAPYPVGASLTYEVYKRIPNDTDMTVFKAAGIAGLNFAFVDGWEHYHTPLDRPDNLSVATLGHLGSYAFALSRHFGAADLDQLSAPDQVYFSVPGGWMFVYSQGFAIALSLVSAIAYAALIFRVARKGLLLKRRVLLGLGMALFSVILACAAAFGYQALISHAHRSWIGSGNGVFSGIYCCALVFLAIAIASLGQTLSGDARWRIAVALGQLSLWLVLQWTATFFMSGASYLFTVPLLAGLATVGGMLEIKSQRTVFLVGLVLALPTLLIFAPLGHALFTIFGVTVQGAIAIAAITALAISALSAQWTFMLQWKPRAIPLCAIGISAVLGIVGVSTVRYSAQHPQRYVQLYVADADEHRAMWASSAPTVDAWNGQFLGTAPKLQVIPQLRAASYFRPLLVADAPRLELQPPEVTLVASEVHGERRILKLHVQPMRHARGFALFAPNAQVLDSSVAGRQLQEGPMLAGDWTMSYTNPPAEGVDVQLQVAGTQSMKLVVLDYSDGLPRIPGREFSERPADSMSHNSGDATLVHRAVSF